MTTSERQSGKLRNQGNPRQSRLLPISAAFLFYTLDTKKLASKVTGVVENSAIAVTQRQKLRRGTDVYDHSINVLGRVRGLSLWEL